MPNYRLPYVLRELYATLKSSGYDVRQFNKTQIVIRYQAKDDPSKFEAVQITCIQDGSLCEIHVNNVHKGVSYIIRSCDPAQVLEKLLIRGFIKRLPVLA